MNRLFTKKLLAAAVLALPCVAAQAAQTITFPTGTLTTSNTVYQLTSGIASNGAFQAGTTQITGFGTVNTLTQNNVSQSLPNMTFCGGVANCELTYAFSGFTYTGAYTNNGGATGAPGVNNTTGSRDYYFSGGSFGLYIDFTPDAVAPMANSSVSQFATAGQKFIDGTNILTAAARAGGTIPVSGGGTSSTVTNPPVGVPTGSAPPQPTGCVLVGNAFGFDFYTCTVTTFSVTGATLKVTQDFSLGTFSGSVLFDATGGQGFNNFNRNTQAQGTDLSAIISFASPTSCVFDPSTGLQQCAGSSTTSATVTPGTITVIPEPTMLAIFGTGMLGLGFMRRRRQSKH